MNLRREARYTLKSYGRYRRGHGRAYSVQFEDISEFGCRFHDLIGRLAPGDRLTLRIGEFGPIGAHVKWNDRRIIGIEFDQPLHPAVLDHINQFNQAEESQILRAE
ncbi:hypothetical protein GRI58_09365 [Porphyrobacter algicida]|uniref:PilZ domain-containing protein n=1 Tax=Qipengyuania algicida TaxID=1836209 RepID=A0A845AJE9_9SPHN|nr:PilZ domain-containing protein [Qipengyuania algicida]MXP29031.1 hypothetical protein [Qipengyuania algicida]